jgi:hypothetical protein
MPAHASEPVQSIIYAVGSQAEKVALEQQFHETTAQAVDHAHRFVFVVDTPAAATQFITLVQEQMQFGNFVLDLR